MLEARVHIKVTTVKKFKLAKWLKTMITSGSNYGEISF